MIKFKMKRKTFCPLPALGWKIYGLQLKYLRSNCIFLLRKNVYFVNMSGNGMEDYQEGHTSLFFS